MLGWVTVATIHKTTSKHEGFVLRCKADSLLYLHPGLRVAFVPPELDCPREAVIQSMTPLSEFEASVSFGKGMTPEIAGLLKGKKVLVAVEGLPEEFFAEEEDVTDWLVVDERFGELGRVAEVVEGPMQDLLVVVGKPTPRELEQRDSVASETEEEREVLIPFVDAFVLNEDPDAQILTVGIPAGLLTLGAE